MTDYDGTLAPFCDDRDQALPYPGVERILERIVRDGSTRVVVVTGRPVGEIPKLMQLSRQLEIWGSHGVEHRLPDGTCHLDPPGPAARAALVRARERAAARGWSKHLEVKPASLALHWRGKPAGTASALLRGAREEWQALTEGAGLELLEFDGGVELRLTGRTKAAAVDALFREMGEAAAVAYLGDDATDEDAFRALDGRGLGVLVRAEPRETIAAAHLVPPEQLLDFLERWAASCRVGR